MDSEEKRQIGIIINLLLFVFSIYGADSFSRAAGLGPTFTAIALVCWGIWGWKKLTSSN